MQEITTYSNKLLPLAVTAAHEYNHVVQFSYDFIQDPWMFESTATAYEELVFPGVNDYLQYISEVANKVSVPLTTFGNNLKPYGDVVWTFFLIKRHGARVIPKSWGKSLKTKPPDFAALAYDRGIRGASRGRSDFVEEFVKFAASLPEWRGSGLYPDSNRYPNVQPQRHHADRRRQAAGPRPHDLPPPARQGRRQGREAAGPRTARDRLRHRPRRQAAERPPSQGRRAALLNGARRNRPPPPTRPLIDDYRIPGQRRL